MSSAYLPSPVLRLADPANTGQVKESCALVRKDLPYVSEYLQNEERGDVKGWWKRVDVGVSIVERL